MAAELQPGAKVLGYEVVGELGRGGMGIVYRAYQPALDRFVALKVLPTALASDDVYLKRFQAEVRVAARLEHPNIVPIYEVGEWENQPFIAMRLIEGVTLAQFIEEHGILPVETARSLLAQIADALDFAHERNIVHRDVKPANILVDARGGAHLMDFGIAHVVGTLTRLTGTGDTVGTPNYMAPEQATGQLVSAATDRYALGVIAYQLLTGRLPFMADTSMAVMYAHVNQPTPPLRTVRPELPVEVDAAVQRMLAKKPDGRWESCTEFVSALDATAPLPAELAAADATQLAAPAASYRPRPLWKPAFFVAIAIAVVGMVAVVGLQLVGPRGAGPQPTPFVAGSGIGPGGTPIGTGAPPPTTPLVGVPPSGLSPTTAPRNRELEQAVLAAFQGLPPGASAVFQNLNGPDRVELDPIVQVPSASVIKLPIMIEVLRQEAEGTISLDAQHTITRQRVVGGTGILQNQVGRTLTTRELLEIAIAYSDNVGGNLLVNVVGMPNVNNTMRTLGYPQTRLARPFMDLDAQRRGLDNLTSARDMTAMLQAIYEGKVISPAASAEMLRLLRLRGLQNDPTLDYVGRRLSPRPSIAHLNGSFTGIRNEAAIIETEGRPYILTIFLRGQSDESAAEDAIARASEQIWHAVRGS